jgi:anaerobic C4-dicarboxylate transport
MGKISPFEIVKRMSVPMLVGFICVIIGTEIFVSVAPNLIGKKEGLIVNISPFVLS